MGKKRRDELDVAAIIKDARLKRGLTQIDLAKEIECSNTTVSVLEADGVRGHLAREGVRRAIRLFRALDLNPAKL